MYHNLKKKQIILVRHAKAEEREDWKGKDFDRPLSALGEKSNHIVASYLRLIWLKPDRIVASPAARTKSTAEGIAKKMSMEQVDYVEALYNEVPSIIRDGNDAYFSVIKDTKKSARTLMIVGHNDDLTNFACYLSWDTIPSMKKWSVVVLSLPDDADWKTLKPGTLKFVYYLTPQFLRLEELA
jgi:phosphohistidine phosphatase